MKNLEIVNLNIQQYDDPKFKEIVKDDMVVLGMSGGVDSSVCAYLLKEAGYNVVGIFMKNWEEKDENGNCTSDQDFLDVQKVCDSLNIPCYSVNFAKEYNDRVFSYFLDEYKKGRTPNPDVMCNKEIKFKVFLDYAKQLGAKYVATGHYAQIGVDANGDKFLVKGVDSNKDQTYFLSALSQSQIENIIFPIGNIDKKRVREIAKEANLVVATKKDSTGVCFIGERNFRNFLSTYLPAQSGKIVDIDSGKVVGEHVGLMHYTLGQRHGLGIGGTKDNKEGAWFVCKKDLDKNILYACQGEENKYLYSNNCICTDFSLSVADDIKKQIFDIVKENGYMECNAKFRYRQQDNPVKLYLEDENTIKLVYDQKIKAVTPGQFAVLYLDDVCLGCANIQKVYMDDELIQV